MRNTLYSLFVAAVTVVSTNGADANCAQSTTPILKDSTGNHPLYPYIEDAIQITSQDTDSVTFTVSQLWVQDGTPMFAVSYRLEEDVCDMKANEDGSLVEYTCTSTYTANCVNGYTEIGIYLYVGLDTDFSVEECDACKAPDDNYVGHYVTIPCSICAPSTSPTGAPTEVPTGIPTDPPTRSPTGNPTNSPTNPPTNPPTESPTNSPTWFPTDSPTEPPTNSPTWFPTDSPTEPPSNSPTESPTIPPTGSPTNAPTEPPTNSPTEPPTNSPTKPPTESPTKPPTSSPSESPSGSFYPSNAPTESPTLSGSPSTSAPTKPPTYPPTNSPTEPPSEYPTEDIGRVLPPTPTETPDCSPTASPRNIRTESPTNPPTEPPTNSPTEPPTNPPTEPPTNSPTEPPTNPPTDHPTSSPSESPSGSFYPSNAPTENPTTESSTTYPTGAPSGSPTENIDRVLPPTVCVESVKTKLEGSDGNVDAFPNFSPPITIMTQYVENVTLAVEQVFDERDDVGMMAVRYLNTENSEQSCDAEQMVKFGEKIEISAQCIAGYAQVVLYLYTGDCWRFTWDDYEACTVPDLDKYVAHYYKVPCVPSCKPEVPSCVEGPIVTVSDIDDESDICVYSEMPLMIGESSAENEWVNFTVSNTWLSTGLPEDDITSVSISYINSKTGDPVCEIFDSFPDKFETTGVLQALCEGGVSTVVVNVHSDGIQFQAEDIVTNQCRLPEDIGTCAYEMILPCDSMIMCEGTESPTESPSGSYYPSSTAPTENPTTNSPTEPPTESPTEVPTVSPSNMPTANPSEDIDRVFPTTEPPRTAPPTVDSCPASDAVFIDIDGLSMYPEMPIQINHQNTTHVGFTVVNTFGGTISSVFTQYSSGSFGQSECLQEQNVDDQVSIDFVAQCSRHTKISIVNVWMSDCSTTETFLTSSDGAVIPECCYASEECKTVQYTFKLPCVPEPCPEDELDGRSNFSAEATLNPTKAPIFKEFLVNEEATLNPTKAPALYPAINFELPSPTLYPMGDYDINVEAPSNRRLAAASIPSIREQRTRHPDPFNESEDHFCVTEDYPCGDRGEKVHVCHYSAKTGYKTFCVTEDDSDAVRFYPSDYCGPCVGGFASV